MFGLVVGVCCCFVVFWRVVAFVFLLCVVLGVDLGGCLCWVVGGFSCFGGWVLGVCSFCWAFCGFGFDVCCCSVGLWVFRVVCLLGCCY